MRQCGNPSKHAAPPDFPRNGHRAHHLKIYIGSIEERYNGSNSNSEDIMDHVRVAFSKIFDDTLRVVPQILHSCIKVRL